MAKTFCSGIPRMKLAVESCCEAHDRAYSQGSNVSRLDADRQLYACLAPSRPLFAHVAYLFVRTFGWLFYKG